jgi:MIF4G domain/eIF4-gamma/eIF5/eIF2-epsilon
MPGQYFYPGAPPVVAVPGTSPRQGSVPQPQRAAQGYSPQQMQQQQAQGRQQVQTQHAAAAHVQQVQAAATAAAARARAATAPAFVPAEKKVLKFFNPNTNEEVKIPTKAATTVNATPNPAPSPAAAVATPAATVATTSPPSAKPVTVPVAITAPVPTVTSSFKSQSISQPPKSKALEIVAPPAPKNETIAVVSVAAGAPAATEKESKAATPTLTTASAVKPTPFPPQAAVEPTPDAVHESASADMPIASTHDVNELSTSSPTSTVATAVMAPVVGAVSTAEVASTAPIANGKLNALQAAPAAPIACDILPAVRNSTAESTSEPVVEARKREVIVKVSSAGADVASDNDIEDAVSDSVPKSPPRRARRPVMRFEEGERRRYPLWFVKETRSFAQTDKTPSYLKALDDSNLNKWKQDAGGQREISGSGSSSDARGGDLRGSATMRGGGITGGGAGPNRGAMMHAGADAGMRRGGTNAFLPGGNRPVAGSPPGPLGGGVALGVPGGYDQFDLSFARLRAPPPNAAGGVPGSGSGDPSGFNSDPRGKGQLAPLQGGGVAGAGSRGHGRFDGPTRNHGVGPMDYAQSFAPVEKLVKSENAWSRAKENDDEVTAKVKSVRAQLNKLTLEKFDKIFAQIVELDISNLDVLRGIVKEIFEKTLTEPMFAGMYSELCRRLNSHYEASGVAYADENGRELSFRKVLLTNCREEFVRFADSEKVEAAEASAEAEAVGKSSAVVDVASADADVVKNVKAKVAGEAMEAKKRMLGNVRFIGELYKKDLLSENIIHVHCIAPLLRRSIHRHEDDVIEALCNLLSRTGKKLSESVNKEARQNMTKYFDSLDRLSKDHTLPARTRFMLQDLAEQRKNGWNMRRDEQSAKTISEIHDDIQKEERAKEQAQASSRNTRPRSGSGGGGGFRDRNSPTGHSSAPRMTMQMPPPATRQGSGSSGVTRTQTMIDKYASRSSSSTTSSAAASAGMGAPGAGSQVRLGPGGGKASGQWKSAGGSGGGSLRPTSSRFGASTAGGTVPAVSTNAPENRFAMLETEESLRGDVRQGGVRAGVGARSRGGVWQSSRVQSATPSEAPVAPAVEQSMPVEKLKVKTSSLVKEYWQIKDLKEAHEILVEEITAPNFVAFVTEMVKLCLEASGSERLATTDLFVGLLQETIPAAAVKDGLRPIIASLVDLEVDDPKAISTVAKYIGAMASSGKFGDVASFGLDFLFEASKDISDKKKAMKLVVLTFVELDLCLAKTENDNTKRISLVVAAYRAAGIDLMTLAVEWNPVRGVDSLRDMLKDAKAEFLAPMLPVQVEVPKMLAAGKSAVEVTAYIKSAVSENDLVSEALARTLVSLLLTWSFEAPATMDQFTIRFKKISTPIMKACCIIESNPADAVQMAIILETQAWLAGAATTLAAIKDTKPTGSVFQQLYDDDLVDEETFLLWKEDVGESTKIAGKSEAVLGSSAFFQWLATADDE